MLKFGLIASLPRNSQFLVSHNGVLGGGGGREPGSNGGGRSTGGGVFKGDGSREKWEKFRNIDSIFCNRKSTQRRELLQEGAGGGKFRPPLLSRPPPPPLNSGVELANLERVMKMQISLISLFYSLFSKGMGTQKLDWIWDEPGMKELPAVTVTPSQIYSKPLNCRS